MAAENKDAGSAATLATLARGVGGAAAGVAQAVFRAAGEALASALGTVVKSSRVGSGASADASPGLRAIVGGAAARARRRQDVERAASATTARQEWPVGEGALLDEEPNEDRLVALPRDPQSLFAYWHLGVATQARRDQLLRAGSGLLREALLVEVTDEAPRGGTPGTESWIVPLPPLAVSCHLELRRPRVRARLTLGLHADGAPFTPLAESTPITLSATGPAEVTPPRWQRLSFGGEHAGSPPAVPRREVSEQLLARAAEHERVSSEVEPRPHDPIQGTRDAGAGRSS